MTPHDLLSGMSVDDMVTAGYQIALYFPYEDIENFWLLEFLSLGLFGFLLWLASFACLMAFAWRHASGWGMIMLVTLVLVATTSNSFGRKDLVLNCVIAAVMTAVPPRRDAAPAFRQAARPAPALRRLAPPA